MSDTVAFSANVGDLVLTVSGGGERWRACVEECDDSDSRMSDGIDYVTLDRAKRGAVRITRELFGTAVDEAELQWRQH